MVNSIYGILGDVPEDRVAQMGQRLAHRGVRHKTTRVDDRVVLGYGCDHSESRIYNNDRYAVVSDGSIYNKNELADYANKKGIGLVTDNDEEIILAMLKTEGTEGIEKINGDFAFAIWDKHDRELILGRDLSGCRPFYYTKLPFSGLAFASEYKAVLCIPGLQTEYDLDMIQCLQYYKKLPVGRTLFKKIHAVGAACIERFNEEGKKINTQTMSPIKASVVHNTEMEAAPFLFEKLKNAIRIRIEDKSNIGIALSGGIDSIGIAFICRGLFPDAQIHTFTAGYGDNSHDVKIAEKVANLIRSQHHKIETPPSLIGENINRLVWHLEDPYARSESLQLLKIGEEAGKHVSSLICGMEADALFGGMPRHKILWLMMKYPFLKKPLSEIYDFTQCGLQPESVVGKTLKTIYFRDTIPDVPKIKGANFSPRKTEFPVIKKEYFNAMLSNGFQNGACQDGQKLERTFAAHGVQYRTPFLDRNLVEAAYSISDTLKFKNRVQKYILRKALEPIVPQQLLYVPKNPQRMDYDLQFRSALNEVAKSYLDEKSVHDRGFFDYKDIEKLMTFPNHKPYPAEWSMRMWTAACTEVWAREFIDKQGRGF